ncbi:Ltp family lipoprotein [Actinoplanes sp. NPDC048791]|uniref:Ltp family lipoprotein n=1 Tax=Actinoplanes sp. NPDC048791 TaxID=3154623 RepID=UPI0033C8D13D
MPEPVDATQRIVLDAIWALLLRAGRWPTFHELDQHLYRLHDLDAARLLPEMPPGLLHGVNSGSSISIAGTTTIGLTAAGAAATGRARRELDLFLAVVRHAAAVQRDYDPPADQPDRQAVLAAADVAMLLGLSLPEDAALLRRLGAILYTERWGWTTFGGRGTEAWTAAVDREVRRFRNVRDLSTYWELRPKHWLPNAPVPPAARRQAARDDTADRPRGAMGHVDVLVVAALREEFDAALGAASAADPGGPGVSRWQQRDVDGSPYSWGEYRIDGKLRFTVAVARPTHMGGRTTGSFVARLADRLHPTAVAMCGVCAGDPARAALGDVVVGTPVFEWDEGKHSASGFEGDHRQFSLDLHWLRAAQEFDPRGLPAYGDPSDDEALLWFLEQLHRGQHPRSHPARDAYFPSGTWPRRLAQFETQGLIRRESNGEPKLTGDGSDLVQRRLYDDVEGPQRLPFRVLTAPMASGSAVITDPAEWDRLRRMGVRSITAIEMEAATIATVADDRGLPWLVAKGVMDHADAEKDDRYKRFAARASAQVMFALLERLAPATMVAGADPTVNDAATEPTVDPTRIRPTAGTGSAEQKNAVRSAKEYLKIAPFSREGLIELLSAAGYPLEVSTHAVDSLDIDYDEQAVKSAQSYLRVAAFSRKGLIEMLSSAGYSLEASTHAVDSLDIDYDEQAASSAQSHLRVSGSSRKGLIELLKYAGFTHSQAVHGADKAGL